MTNAELVETLLKRDQSREVVILAKTTEGTHILPIEMVLTDNDDTEDRTIICTAWETV